MANPTVTISELTRVVRVALQTPVFQPIGLLAAPGVGKTQFFQHVMPALIAEHHGIQVDDVHVIIEKIGQREDASAITGITIPSKDSSGQLCGTVAKPYLILRIEQAIAAGAQQVLLVLDEFPQAPTDVQAAASDMLNPEEHKIGDWKMPDCVRVVLTGNRMQDKSGAKRVLSHLRNGRVKLFDLAFDIKGWADWAAANGVHPLVIDCAVVHYEKAWEDSGVWQGFFAESVPTEDVAFNTPRSLVRASDDINAWMDSLEFDGLTMPSYMVSMVAANTGPQAAEVIRKFIDYSDKIPMGDDIIRDPYGATVPDQMGYQCLAGQRAIAAAVDAPTGEAALAYITRLRADLQVSLGNKLLRMSADRDWTLTSDEADDFVIKFHDLMPLAAASGMSKFN